MKRRVDLTGPGGYSHGWVFHGVPGVTSHSDLLKMRAEARAAHPQGHPERLKAERAVRHSRKLAGTQKKATGDRGETRPIPEMQYAVQKAEAKARANQEARDKAAGLGGPPTILNPHTEGVIASGAPGKSLGRGGDKPKRITAAEKRALSNILAIPESEINSGNIAELRQRAKGNRAPQMPVTPGEGPRHEARFKRGKVEVAGDAPKQPGETAQQYYNRRRLHQLMTESVQKPPGAGGFQPGDRVATDTGVTGTVHSVQGHRVRVKSASYIRGYQHINASRLRKLSQSRAAVELSAETPRLVATPAPLGKPGGPGLYHLKGAKLPNYIENMRNALMRGGMKEGRATATAISRCKVLAVTSKHPEVKAAAAAAIAELKATAARAKASHGHANEPGTVVELFNQFHLPAGTGGGQFTTASGASGGAKAPAKATSQRGTTPSGTRPAAQKAAIMRQVRGLRERIGAQTRTLAGLKAQRHSLVQSVSTGGSKATGTTKKAKKAATIKKSKTTVKQKAGAKRKATTKTTGAAKAASRAATMGQIARLGMRISSLSTTIAHERGQVRTLLAKARGM